MSTRVAGIRSTFLFFLAAAFLSGSAAEAQWCSNNPSVSVSDLCYGQYSLQSTIAGGCCGTGSADTAVGFFALSDNTTGGEDTGIGAYALKSTTTASYDTAVGYDALGANTTGEDNTAVGARALQVSQTAGGNTALGFQTLNFDTTGHNNTAVGSNTLANLTSGSSNLVLGVNAGANYTAAESNNIVLANFGIGGESGVIRIGTGGSQTKAFISGIYGATSASGTQVLVNSSGQLGTTTSSLRFKDEVADMGAASRDLLKLRPVTFRYKPAYDDGERLLQYGLVAEEVAKVNPGLVQFGEDGQPLAVRYHFIYAMLLNEVQEQHSTIAGQAARLAAQAETLDRQAAEIASQKTAIEELAARLARLEKR